jgi:hypothetical protein
MTYLEQLDILKASHPVLGDQVARLRNLEAILKWTPEAGIAFAGIDLVQQDEYSYDLFLPLPDSTRWLVFGVS